MLNVSFTMGRKSASAKPGAIGASVVTNPNIVAMSGWIMPEPLAMPPTW
jgi:hypothetical protein